MSYYVRPYEDRDYEQVAHIADSFYKGKHGSFSLIQHINGMLSKYVVSDEAMDAIYGYALLSEQIAPKLKLRLELFLNKRFDIGELGRELYNHVERDMLHIEPYVVEVRVFTENEAEHQFYRKRGFEENHRMVKQLLHVRDADLRFDWEEWNKKGFVLTTMADERMIRPDYMEQIEALFRDTAPDFPNELPVHLRQVNSNTGWLHQSDIIPEAFFIAVHKGCYVGFSHLFSGPDHTLTQGFTAVRSDFRNQGIATALKIRVIEYARKDGFGVIYTANRSTNGAMAAINAKLGWTAYDSEIRLEKIINPSYKSCS